MIISGIMVYALACNNTGLVLPDKAGIKTFEKNLKNEK